MKRSVAVIGVGVMGTPIAQRFLAAGYEVTACDRNAALLAPLQAAGARIVGHADACAQAELVIVLVSTPEQVREVTLGERGLARGAVPGSNSVVGIMSTVPASVVIEIAAGLAQYGMRVIDAPVSGGVARAEAGTLALMCGGEAAQSPAVREAFACIASQQFQCGALGSAQNMKIINNLLGIANAVLAAEAYRLALGRGLDLARVSAVFEAGTGRNYLSEDPAGPQATYASMTRDRARFASLRGIMRKDLALAAELAAHTPGQFPGVLGLEAIIASLGEGAFDEWRSVAEVPPAGG